MTSRDRTGASDFRLSLLKDWARIIVAFGLAFTAFQFTVLRLGERIAPSLISIDKIYFVVLSATIVCLPFVAYPTNSNEMRSRFLADMPKWVTLGGGLALACATWAVYGKDGAGPATILMSSSLATIGWLVSQSNARKMSRRQHTLNVLLAIRSNSILSYHQANILSAYKNNSPVPWVDVPKLLKERDNWQYFLEAKSTSPVFSPLESVLWVSNFYEHLALSMHKMDIDSVIMKESLRGIICRFFLKVYPVIAHFRQIGSDGVAANPKAYEYLTWCFYEWATEVEKRRLREIQDKITSSSLPAQGNGRDNADAPPSATV